MAQLNNNLQQTYLSLLQEVLRLVAQKPTLAEATSKILPPLSTVADAEAAFFVVVTEPFASFTHQLALDDTPSDEWCMDVTNELTEDIHLTSALPPNLQDRYSGALLSPIMYKGDVIAVLGLLLEEEVALTEAQTNILQSLVDSLKIVTIATHVDALHVKFTRNQNEFVRIVSHDLRSPLTSIKGFASMLESAEEDPKKLHFAEKILNGVTQMTSLVDNIQDAGRFDRATGFYEMERAPTDLIDMVDGIVNNHLVPAEKQEVTLKTNIADGIPIVNVDANMIERSIINLVDNAIKYTPNGGTIEVGLRVEDGQIVISISDTGYGISEENIKSLFKRHFRIRRREHARVKGSGLGLFIVRSVAQHHAGDAFVESTFGEGSTFGIRIPLAGENLLGGASV
ncbi:MAG: HAMP domain-containing sensor histidine kinase [Chloroflexota bacterium]